MKLAGAVRSCFSSYFQFSGRATRSEFWKFFLFVVLGGIACIILNSLLFGPEIIEQTVTTVESDGSTTTGSRRIMSYTGGLFDDLFLLACLIPFLAVGWRRLHDTDKAGWWFIAPLLIFLTAVIAVPTFSVGPTDLWTELQRSGTVRVKLSGTVGVLLMLIIFVPHILLLLRLCCRSDPHPNRYGPNPLEVTP